MQNFNTPRQTILWFSIAVEEEEERKKKDFLPEMVPTLVCACSQGRRTLYAQINNKKLGEFSMVSQPIR